MKLIMQFPLASTLVGLNAFLSVLPHKLYSLKTPVTSHQNLREIIIKISQNSRAVKLVFQHYGSPTKQGLLTHYSVKNY
jgi:hypothetical protein